MRDLSRATSLAPTQHKTSMMVAKTFERIHVIAIDTSTFPGWFGLEDDDAFVSVVASVNLNDTSSELSNAAITAANGNAMARTSG